MSDNEEKLQQFIAVAGVDAERARFYMESSAWDLELALTSFYDADSDQPEVISVENPQESEVQGSPVQPSQISKSKSRPKKTNSRFGTLNTLNNSSEDEEEGQQAFYAGGSENSGQQVLGPSKKKDIVAEMFKSVQEHGVEILDSSAGTSTRAFKGTGYKLGQTVDDSEAVPGASEPPQPVQVTMKLWRDGFSVNDGPHRSYVDPSNREFLDSVRRGEIPHELRHGISEVHLSMEDHRMEEFKQDVQGRYTKPFSGQGHTLGSPTPATVGAPLDEDKNVNEAHARELIGIDPNQPTTNLQIRLADGSRLLGQFNHGQTVGQVRSFIIAARPQYETRPFSLISTYPSKELEDAQTIADAGILNSAIMQKLVKINKGPHKKARSSPSCGAYTRAFPGPGYHLASTDSDVLASPASPEEAAQVIAAVEQRPSNEASAESAQSTSAGIPEEDAQVRRKARIRLDLDLPVTKVQIRLADGSMLVAYFNHVHTIGDVRAFIIAARPRHATETFALVAFYPCRELEDDQTLEEARVLSSVIFIDLDD